MGWSHPDISLDDLLALIKGFVDILVLASGYQSSGLPATWDVDNIKKALQWGLFFEDVAIQTIPFTVFDRLRDSEYFEESVKELDAVLLKLTSDSFFPQGLAHMSSATLSEARDLVLEHLLGTHPLKDAHLTACLTAIIKMDVDNLTKMCGDGTNTYIDRLLLHMESLKLSNVSKGSIKDATTSSETDLRMHNVCNPKEHIDSTVKSKGSKLADNSCFIVQGLLKRQALVSSISSVETGLDSLLEIVKKCSLIGSENNPSEGLLDNSTSPEKEEIFSELCLWNQWKSKCLSYLLDKRTIRLLSGANLIFSAPKVQWIRVFERLKASMDVHSDNVLETMEILLLGFISSRWNHLLEHFTSQSCDFLPISKQYSDLHHLLQANSQSLQCKRENMDFKERNILEYLTSLVRAQPQKLWQVAPVLAAAIPSRSILFRMYLSDIEGRFNEDSSLVRCCGCSRDATEHKDCEVAERIRCLYVFHIRGSHLMVGDCNS